jgi:multicomponent Na+:H+ antiporter subunit B
MISIILRTTTRLLVPLMLLFSAFLLIRGHDEPGGGFPAGLIAAAAFILYAMAFDTKAARSALRLDPHVIIGIGLLLATVCGLASLTVSEPFLTAHWWGEVQLAADMKVVLGTPLWFELGVYLTVVGATAMIVLNLLED